MRRRLLESDPQANLSRSAIGRLARALGITSKQLTEIGG